MEERKLLTFDEVKKYLKVNRSTLYKFVQEGTIPALKLGRQWRFDLGEIEARLRQQSLAYQDKKHDFQDKKQDQPEAKPAQEVFEPYQTNGTAEKREFFRLANQFPVKCSLIDDSEQVFNATGRNISEGGIFIEPEAIEYAALPFANSVKRKRLSLRIEFPQKVGSIEVQAEIVWRLEQPWPARSPGLGLKFSNLLPEAKSKISSYIRQQSASRNGLAELTPIHPPICLESSIVVKRKPEEVYQLLQAIEGFPEFIPSVKSVRVIEKGGSGAISQWTVEIDGLQLQWRQLDIFDRESRLVRFRMLAGDLEKYAGQWKLIPLLTGTEIRLSLVVDWGVHSLRQYVGSILEEKTENLLQGMLAGIKQRLWTENTARLVKFAFMVHPYDLEVIDTQFHEPACRTKRRPFLEKFFEYLNPFACAHVTGVRSVTGRQIDGELIYCPFLPNQILSLDSRFVLDRVVEAAKIAEKIGAKILGLGAYAANVGRKGLLVAKELNIPVTTGTSFTIVTAIEATLKLAREIGIELSRVKVAVIGATGAIGQIYSQVLANSISDLILVARNKEKLKSLADAICRNTQTKVTFTHEINQAVRHADIIVTATSTPSALIDISLLQPGTLICDISVPKNVSLEAANSRRNILVVDGGIVKPPGDVNFNFYFGLPPGLCYACMAETMILTLEEKFENYSIGGNISLAKVMEISQLGAKHGFKLAEFRSFSQLISKERIKEVKEAFEKR